MCLSSGVVFQVLVCSCSFAIVCYTFCDLFAYSFSLHLAITCDDLPDPTYGSVTLTGNRVGAYANYKCDYGFQINGDNQRVCLSTGKWSGAAPVCDRK